MCENPLPPHPNNIRSNEECKPTLTPLPPPPLPPPTQLFYLLFTFLTYVYWESPRARRVRAGLPPATPAKSDVGYTPSPARSVPGYNAGSTPGYSAASPSRAPAYPRGRAAEQFGVGVVLTTDAVDGSLKVASLIPGGPAERSGRVFEGDEIVTIDAHPVDGLPLNQLAGALLGQVNSVECQPRPFQSPQSAIPT